MNTFWRKMMNIGIIGLGHWGPNIVRNFVGHPRVNLKYVCDVLESSFKGVKGLLPKECKCVTDASLVVNASDIDSVAIITPASTHYDLVKKALLAGKHVFSEKPLALDGAKCEELCAIAKSSGCKLMVGYTFLFNNAVRKLKELIDSERLGKLYYLTAMRTHMGLVRKDVSVAWDLAPHDVSIMNYLLNAVPEKVSAVSASPLGFDQADIAFITLFYPGGIVGQIHVSWVDSNKERRVHVIGSKARAVFNDLNNLEPVRLFEKGICISDSVEPDFGNFRFLLRDGDIISPKVDMREPVSQMSDAFVRLVLDNEENIVDGGFDLGVTRTLVAAHKSMRAGGIPQNIN
ncbi:MAG: Gfo/Idh/MocA family oxidoreductase [Candidatus Aureabacteria bacterium]|nr:Gfo/Idh/MocA family oxidoreductase [Candidatus Auribacterota bacterium]